MRFSRILVPIDFSTGADEAAVVAAAMARQLGGSIELVHVYNPPSIMLPDGSTFAPTPAQLVEASDHAEHALDAARRALVARVGDGVRVDSCTRIGAAADEIVRLADSGKYDLVVMGTHGRTGIRRLVLGSVAEKVLRRASIPVLTVRDPASHPAVERSF